MFIQSSPRQSTQIRQDLKLFKSAEFLSCFWSYILLNTIVEEWAYNCWRSAAWCDNWLDLNYDWVLEFFSCVALLECRVYSLEFYQQNVRHCWWAALALLMKCKDFGIVILMMAFWDWLIWKVMRYTAVATLYLMI